MGGDCALVTGDAAEDATHAFENLTDNYLTFGTDGNQAAPFVGPAGVVVTPTVGTTRLNGLRIYAANDAPERDPGDYKIEGSNDGGSSYGLVASGSVLLPVDRNATGAPVDPLTQVNREIRFANLAAYASYRVSFTNLRNNATANSMQIGEIELLGTVVPVLRITVGTGGTLTITSSQPGTLWSSADLTAPANAWTNEGPISGSVEITPNLAQPQKYYRVSMP